MTKIDNNIDSDERVLWRAKPKFVPFIWRNISASIVGVFFLIFVLLIFLIPALSGAPIEFMIFMIPFILIPLFIIFGPLIWGFLAFKNTEYIITDKRLISQTGAIGLDARFVDLEKIQEVYVKIGLIDRLYSTGSIYAPTAGQAFMGMRTGWGGASSMIIHPYLSSIEKPYEVQNLLQEAVQNIKISKT